MSENKLTKNQRIGIWALILTCILLFLMVLYLLLRKYDVIKGKSETTLEEIVKTEAIKYTINDTTSKDESSEGANKVDNTAPRDDFVSDYAYELYLNDTSTDDAYYLKYYDCTKAQFYNSLASEHDGILKLDEESMSAEEIEILALTHPFSVYFSTIDSEGCDEYFEKIPTIAHAIMWSETDKYFIPFLQEHGYSEDVVLGYVKGSAKNEEIGVYEFELLIGNVEIDENGDWDKCEHALYVFYYEWDASVQLEYI